MILSSESSALSHRADFVREIDNGETVVINKDGIQSSKYNSRSNDHKMCIFEQIYFSRPDSIIDGQLAYESRVKMGESLARAFSWCWYSSWSSGFSNSCSHRVFKWK